MSCCGDRRRALTQSLARPAPAPGQKPAVAAKTAPGGPAHGAASAANAPVLVRYLGGADIVAHGQTTKNSYAFSRARPVRPVDARDALILLRSKAFARA